MSAPDYTHHMTAVSEGDEIIRIPLAQHVGHRILQFPPPYLHLENENIQNGGHACAVHAWASFPVVTLNAHQRMPSFLLGTAFHAVVYA